MKVGLIGPIHPFRSGEAQSNTMLCENLAPRHQVIAYSFKRLYPKRLFRGKSQTDESKKELGFTARYSIDSMDPLTWARTLADIRRENFDVVLVTWWTIFLAPCYVFLLSAIRLTTRTKICIFAHNVYPHEDNILNKALARSVLPLAHWYVVLSSKSLHDLKQLYPNARVKLLLEPTYDHHFKQKRSTRAEARKKLGIGEANVALFFGLVREYKGLKYLIAAMPEALAHADIRFLVVGEFWDDRRAHEAEAERLGVRHKLTLVDRFVSDEEAVDYFDAADIFVLPYIEPTGTAVVPLAYGYDRPVIVSDVLGLTDFVDQDKTGYIVPPKAPGKLAQALAHFFNDVDREQIERNVVAKRRELEWTPEKDQIVFHGL